MGPLDEGKGTAVEEDEALELGEDGDSQREVSFWGIRHVNNVMYIMNFGGVWDKSFGI